MSKNYQDKKYYEIGIFSLSEKCIINEYVTDLPIVDSGVIYEPLVEFLHNENPGDIMILLNTKNGKLSRDSRSVIKIRVPVKPTFKYNR